MRLVLADDAVLLREGLVRLLTEQGHDVVAVVGDGPSLVAAAAEHRPDRVHCGCTDAADAHRRGSAGGGGDPRRSAPAPRCSCCPSTSRCPTPTTCSPTAAARSATCSRTGSPTSPSSSRRCIGWPAAGPCSTPRWWRNCWYDVGPTIRSEQLTPREREVLALMAEGRSNTAIARHLVVSEGAVEKHVRNIFTKLDLPPDDGHEPSRARRARLPTILTFAVRCAASAAATGSSTARQW